MDAKILVVDDNPDIIESVKALFADKESGISVVGADSGKEALKILCKEPFHLVLLDIMMPQMIGWDVAAKMKEDPKLKDIPIIYLTAKSDDLSRQMGDLSGEDYIQKPFVGVDLVKRVKDVLIKRQYVISQLRLFTA